MRTHALLPLLALAFGGCTTPTAPTGAPLTEQDFGPAPSSQASAVAFIRSKLRDPYSAVIEHRIGPKRLTIKHSMIGPGGYGWATCFSVNAKNAFGGYVGPRPVVVVERYGSVVRHFGVTGSGFDPDIARSLCEQTLPGL